MAATYFSNDIVFVGSDTSLAELIDNLFADEGIAVRHAPDADALIRMVTQRRPRLVIVSTGRRMLSNLAPVEQLRLQGYINVPVILMTTDPLVSRTTYEEHGKHLSDTGLSADELDELIERGRAGEWDALTTLWQMGALGALRHTLYNGELEELGMLQHAAERLNIHGVLPMPFDYDQIMEMVMPFMQPRHTPAQEFVRWLGKGVAHRPAPTSPAPSSAEPKGKRPSRHTTPSAGTVAAGMRVAQRDLALALIALIGVVGSMALITPEGMVLFDKLLPALMFVLGYFYRQERA